MNPRTRVLTVTATAVTLIGLAIAPAAAERATYADPADATGSLTDIRQVTVKHGPTQVKVKVRFTDLRRTSDGGPASINLLIDTRATTKAPDYQLVSGLQSGTDYQLVKLKRGKPVGDPLECPHDLTLKFGKDRLDFSAARSCLGDPEQVRVAVRMTDDYDSSHPITDWLGEPKSFTDWLTSD